MAMQGRSDRHAGVAVSSSAPPRTNSPMKVIVFSSSSVMNEEAPDPSAFAASHRQATGTKASPAPEFGFFPLPEAAAGRDAAPPAAEVFPLGLFQQGEPATGLKCWLQLRHTHDPSSAEAAADKTSLQKAWSVGRATVGAARAVHDLHRIHGAAAAAAAAKLFRGVRQRHRGKWVAEIRLPKNRTRVWVGTFDKAADAAMAYEVAAYYLRGDYANLNFPHLKHLLGPRAGGGGDLHSTIVSLLEANLRASSSSNTAPTVPSPSSFVASNTAGLRLPPESDGRRSAPSPPPELPLPKRQKSSASTTNPAVAGMKTGKQPLDCNRVHKDAVSSASDGDGMLLLSSMPSLDMETIWAALPAAASDA